MAATPLVKTASYAPCSGIMAHLRSNGGKRGIYLAGSSTILLTGKSGGSMSFSRGESILAGLLSWRSFASSTRHEGTFLLFALSKEFRKLAGQPASTACVDRY